MIGNSSAGIREACYFGTPVIDVGTRQFGRMPRGKNVINYTHVSLAHHLQAGRYPIEQLYGNGTAGTQIAEILATIEMPNLQKRFYHHGK